MIEILDAVLSQLRTGTKALVNPRLNQTNSDIQPGGHPPPSAQQTYISLDEGSVTTSGGDAQFELNELFTIDVFISLQLGSLAADRYAQHYRDQKQGLATIERQIKAALHGQHAVRIAANCLLESDEAVFLTPLYYVGRQKTDIRDASWSGLSPEVPGWLVRKLSFIGCRRVHYLDSI